MKCFILNLLLIIFLPWQAAIGQSPTDTLRVGDRAPDVKVYKWIKGTPVSGFKKGQVYLVDFGATWCIPCGRAIIHLQSLSKEFGSQLDVMSVFVMELKMYANDNSYVKRVKAYVMKRGSDMEYSVGVDDPRGNMENRWLAAGHLHGIPWAFVIDKNGLIAWVGDPSDPIVEKKIQYALSQSYTILGAIEQSKIESGDKGQWVDYHKPLFIDGNGGDGKAFLYRSILTSYNGEKSGNVDFVYSTKWAVNMAKKQIHAGMVQQIGAPLLKLYYMAYADTMGNSVYSRELPSDEFPDTVKYPTTVNRYGKYWYTPVLEVRDTMPFQFSFNSKANRYNYSLTVPDEKASAKFLQQAMQRDLKTYFGYNVAVEERMMPCWNLIASEQAKKSLKTKIPGNKFKHLAVNDTLYRFTNAVTKDIMIDFILSVYSFGYASFGVRPKIEPPFFDETGVANEIDYEFSKREFDGMRNGDWDMLMRFLQRLGLDLVKGERLIRVVVIRDSK